MDINVAVAVVLAVGGGSSLLPRLEIEPWRWGWEHTLDVIEGTS
jgi:hypothetical protein